MMKKIIFLLCFCFVSIIARPITFQLYVFDTISQVPLNTTGIVSIESSLVDGNGHIHFEQSQDQSE